MDIPLGFLLVNETTRKELAPDLYPIYIYYSKKIHQDLKSLWDSDFISTCSFQFILRMFAGCRCSQLFHAISFLPAWDKVRLHGGTLCSLTDALAMIRKCLPLAPQVHVQHISAHLSTSETRRRKLIDPAGQNQILKWSILIKLFAKWMKGWRIFLGAVLGSFWTDILFAGTFSSNPNWTENNRDHWITVLLLGN